MPATGYADLHAHTTASDGSLTPAELVRTACAAGLEVLAVTDHDTTAGLAEATEAARQAGIRLVSGVELSAEGSPGKCHLLGLNIDANNPALQEKLRTLSHERQTRNARMIERLQALGVDLSLDEVIRVAPPGANVGRPHFAQALLRKGIVATLPEAFDRFLGDTAPAYVSKAVLPPVEAIALIHGAGGLAFLAHPGLLRLAPEETLRQRIKALQSLGLNGVEVFYPRHSPEQTADLREISASLGLLVTGGSDFHGAAKPDIALGAVIANRGVPLELLPPVLR